MPCKHEGGADPCEMYKRECIVKGRARSLRYTNKFIETVQNVKSGAIGAAGELLVGADLMLRGFSVTKPMDPTAKHDLHVDLPSVGWVGVQVKVVKRNRKTGSWIFSAVSEDRRSPVYAFVLPRTKEIRYEAGSQPLPDELK